MRISRRWKISAALVLVIFCAAAGGARPASRWWWNRRCAAWAAECRTAERASRWDDLQKLAEKWSLRDPQRADPWLFLAMAAQARHDWPAVAEALERIPDSDPKAAPALIELAQLEFGPLNRPLRGEATCQRLLSLEPRAAFGHQRLIQYYAASLQREKLVRQIRFAIGQRREPPEAYVYLLLIDSIRLGNGVELNEHWLEALPDDETFTVAGAIQTPEPGDDTGVPPEQRETARKASYEKPNLIDSLLQKYPANLELLAYMIVHWSTLGEVDRVIELMSQAPEAAERDSRFWRFKGWVHESLDEFPEAEAALQKGLELHPLDWSAWNRLAGLYRRRQDHRQVERLTNLVAQAKALRLKIRKLPTPEAVTPEILKEIAEYARKCGDEQFADALDLRIEHETKRP